MGNSSSNFACGLTFKVITDFFLIPEKDFFIFDREQLENSPTSMPKLKQRRFTKHSIVRT